MGIAEALRARGALVAVVQPETDENEMAFQADIANPAQVDRMVYAVFHRFGRIDILVNNASLNGKLSAASFLDCAREQLDRIVDVNLKGTYYCSQEVARRMISTNTSGRIVPIASVGAFAAQEYCSAYCATKAAQVSLAQTMAIELAPYGIRVNAVAPGDILTTCSANIVKELMEQAQAEGTCGILRLGGAEHLAKLEKWLLFWSLTKLRSLPGRPSRWTAVSSPTNVVSRDLPFTKLSTVFYTDRG